MLVLIIDTSGEKAFVALVRDGDVVGERTWEVSWDAGRQVLNVVDELLEGAGLKLEEIDRIGVGGGAAGAPLLSACVGGGGGGGGGLCGFVWWWRRV